MPRSPHDTTAVADDGINQLVDRIFGDDIVISRQQLVERGRGHVTLWAVKNAVSRGYLVELRVSDRRLLITRESLANWLRGRKGVKPAVNGAKPGES